MNKPLSSPPEPMLFPYCHLSIAVVFQPFYMSEWESEWVLSGAPVSSPSVLCCCIEKMQNELYYKLLTSRIIWSKQCEATFLENNPQNPIATHEVHIFWSDRIQMNDVNIWCCSCFFKSSVEIHSSCLISLFPSALFLYLTQSRKNESWK